MTKDRKECAGEMYNRWSGRSFHCVYSGKHHEDGKWWCGLHAPSKVSARREERWASYRAERHRLAAQMNVASARDAIASVAIGLQEDGVLDNDSLLVAIWNYKEAEKELEALNADG